MLKYGYGLLMEDRVNTEHSRSGLVCYRSNKEQVVQSSMWVLLSGPKITQ